MIDKFECPVCNAYIRLAVPQPAGKKLKCPQCAKVIVIPLANSDEDDEDEVAEIEPKRERIAKRQAAPRAADPEEDREEDEEESPKPKRRKPTKKAKRGGSGMKVAVLVGAALLVVAGVGVGGYFLFTKLPRVMPGLQRDWWGDYVQCFEDASSILVGVKDRAGAEAARPGLIAVGQRLRNGGGTGQEDMTQAPIVGRNMTRAEEAEHDRQRELDRRKFQRMFDEIKRVRKLPGGKELIDAFYASWGSGADYMRPYYDK